MHTNMHMGIIRIDTDTHKRLTSVGFYFKEKQPDTKVTHDYIIRLLLNKYEGDNQ